MRTLFILIIVVSAANCLTKRELASYIPRCSRSDPHLNRCLLQVIEDLTPYLQNGVPELGFPSLSPYVLPEFYVKQDTENLNLTTHVRNLLVSGVENFKFTDLHYDVETSIVQGEITIPPISLSMNTEFTAFVLKTLDLKALDGFLTMALGPTKAYFRIDGALKQKGSDIYYTPTNCKVSLTIENSSVYLSRFTDNLELERLTNQLINKNIKLLAAETTPTLEKFLELLFLRFLKALTRNTPYDNLLLP